MKRFLGITFLWNVLSIKNFFGKRSGKGECFISLDISGLQERIRSSSREKGNERINRNPVFVECSFVFDEEFFFFWKCNRGKRGFFGVKRIMFQFSENLSRISSCKELLDTQITCKRVA